MRDALKREGEHIKFGSDLVSTVTSVLRSLGVVMFGEGDEVGGLLVVSECVEMRKVMGPRKVYVQGVVLRSFLELLSLKGESGGEGYFCPPSPMLHCFVKDMFYLFFIYLFRYFQRRNFLPMLGCSETSRARRLGRLSNY